jgi:hypothetical protein
LETLTREWVLADFWGVVWLCKDCFGEVFADFSVINIECCNHLNIIGVKLQVWGCGVLLVGVWFAVILDALTNDEAQFLPD